MTSSTPIPAPVVSMLSDEEKALVDLLAEVVVESITKQDQ